MTAAPQGRDQLSDDVTLFLHEVPEPTDEQWEQLAALGVRVVAPREPFSAAMEALVSEVVLGDRRHGL